MKLHSRLSRLESEVEYPEGHCSVCASNFQVQSTDVEDINENIETVVTTTFDDISKVSDDGQLENITKPDEMNSELYSITNFLKRPRIIYTNTFPQGTTYGTTHTIQPFDAFLMDAAVKRKWENYAYWQGALRINIVVNSTPFLYGMWQCDWCPLTGNNAAYDVDNIQLAAMSGTKQALNVTSQRPKVLIEPHKDGNYEMILPFIYRTRWHRFDTAATDMGTLTLRPVAPVRAASATTGVPSYSVYASFVDIKIAGPTLVVQSTDEYHSGPISRPASLVAAAAQKLTSVPVIGKFAKATSIGAKAIGDVANEFGMCKVDSVDNVHIVSTQHAAQMGTGEISMAAQRLTIDPKQEITRDRTNIGFDNEDELNIARLCSRSSIVSVVDWQTADTLNQELVQLAITPTTCATLSGTGTYGYPTPAAWMSESFQQWRGDAVIKLRVVKSKYHTGRLLITFDPFANNAQSSTSAQTRNIVWDVTTGDEMTIRVPFLSEKTWKRVYTSMGGISERNGTSLSLGTFSIGYVRVLVLNALTAPLTTATVSLVTELSWENLQFANPKQIRNTVSPWSVQSVDMTDVGHDPIVDDSNYVGQEILSLRQLMNRTEYQRSFGLYNADSSNVFRETILSLPRTPRARGYTGYINDTITKGTIATATNFRFNASANTAVGYFSAPFIGQRGSLIHAVSLKTSYTSDVTGARVTKYFGDVVPNVGFTAINLSDNTLPAYTMSNQLTSAMEASVAIVDSKDANTITVVAPYFSHYDFELNTNTPNTYLDGVCHLKFIVSCDSFGTATYTNGFMADWYCGAGPDFDVFGFVNCPMIGLISAAPTYVGGV